MSTELPDEAIVARLAVGDTRAFPVLVHRYRRRVYAVLIRATGSSHDADDLFQETWIRVARGARGFDPSRSFAGWVSRIATHAAIDWSRAQGTRAGFGSGATGDEADDATSMCPSPAESLANHQQHARVAAALASLPDHMREAVLLRYFDEQDEQEMADQLRVPKGTVKSRLSNALRALRAALGEEAPRVGP